MVGYRARISLYLFLAAVCGNPAAAQKAQIMVLKGADILVSPGTVLEGGMILVKDGVIAEVGRSVKIPKGARVVDVTGKVLAPAFLDARNQGLLDAASRKATRWNATARVADALVACRPDICRSLLKAGVGVTYQAKAGAGTSGVTGAVVIPNPNKPLPEIVRAVGGVAYQLGGASSGRPVPRRPRGRPRRGEETAHDHEASADPDVVDHGDHYHVVKAGESEDIDCALGDQRAARPSLYASRTPAHLTRHGDHFHLLQEGEEIPRDCPEGYWGDNELQVEEASSGFELGDKEELVISGEHSHLVSSADYGTVVCQHCMTVPDVDPGPFRGREDQELPGYLAEKPRPSAAGLLTREPRIKSIESAFDKADRYREKTKKYDKDLEEFNKKLAEWRKKSKSDKKSPGTAKKPAEKPRSSRRRIRRGDLPPEIRKLPLRERLKYMKKLREGGAKGDAKSSSGDGDASGRPKPPKIPTRDPASEAVLDVVDRKVPLRIEAHWKQDILRAIALAKKKEVPLVLIGATEAWKVLDEIKKIRAMVVLGPPMNLSWERLERIGFRPGLAVELEKAGIPFAFMTAGVRGFGPANLPLIASLAIGAGLSHDAALKALTSDAALILGVGEEFGTLEKGRKACIQVLSGKPLEPATRVERMILGNDVIDL